MGRQQLYEGFLSSLRNRRVFCGKKMVGHYKRQAKWAKKKSLISLEFIRYMEGLLSGRNISYLPMNKAQLDKCNNKIKTLKSAEPALRVGETYWGEVFNWEEEKLELLKRHKDSLEATLNGVGITEFNNEYFKERKAEYTKEIKYVDDAEADAPDDSH